MHVRGFCGKFLLPTYKIGQQCFGIIFGQWYHVHVRGRCCIGLLPTCGVVQ